MTNILVDTCFWYALYDTRDEHFNKAQRIQEFLEYGNIIIPYPVLYETLNTRFSCKKEWVVGFNDFLQKESTILIPDDKYKKVALNSVLANAIEGNRPMSLVDMILRVMIDDVSLNIGALITFNERDFYDICWSKNIELISKIKE